jgi:hypothetical protein
MPRRFGTDDELLRHAQLVDDNLREDGQLRDGLLGVGADQAVIDDFSQKHATARSYNAEYNRESAERVGVRQDRQQVFTRADRIYMWVFHRALLAANDDADFEAALGLRGNREQSISGTLRQMRELHEGANSRPDYLERLAKVGATREKLEELWSAIQELQAFDARYQIDRGEALDARDRRDEAFDALAKALGRILDHAKVAFEDRPELLKKFGVA